MFEEVRKAVDDLNQIAPRPGIPALEISEPYDLEDDWPEKRWPGTNQPGVYLFTDSKGSVLYIGKASCRNNIGYRLSAYWKHSSTGGAEPKDDKAKDVKYVLVISLPNERAFEAPAVEEWLIQNLDPPRNHQGR
jgi:hypothetical protein